MNGENQTRNDRVNGLSATATVDDTGRVNIKLVFEGKFGQGYDGCGTHTHQ